jgi:hypothetical protein
MRVVDSITEGGRDLCRRTTEEGDLKQSEYKFWLIFVPHRTDRISVAGLASVIEPLPISRPLPTERPILSRRVASDLK